MCHINIAHLNKFNISSILPPPMFKVDWHVIMSISSRIVVEVIAVEVVIDVVKDIVILVYVYCHICCCCCWWW